MADRINGGSPVVCPQQYRTVPTTVIDSAQQRDRYLTQNEIKELSAFLSSGRARLSIAQTLSEHADTIVAAGGKRIFVGGNPMDYFEKPEDPLGLPGSGYYIAEDYLSAADRVRKEHGGTDDHTKVNTFESPLDWVKGLFFSGKPSLPSNFQAISISDYGAVRMKRSMRDLGWFLRYITYAIVAGDTSIITINTKGLRGVIPENVTVATAVALREMQWKSLSFFRPESAAASLVKRYFDVLIADYTVEKPSDRLRPGVSKHHQGLYLPDSYEESGRLQPRWIMRHELPDIEKDEVIKAAYRQVLERDVSHVGNRVLAEPISQVKSEQGSMKTFVRQLGKSRLYRQLYYEPYTISRSIELACRHFLGRGLSCMEEFQKYFELIADKGFPAVVDAFVDSQEYADYFGEETVPFLRGIGLEAQACRNWGPQLDLFKYSAPVRKVPQFVTTFAGYQQPLPNQHAYGVGNDPLEIQFGAIFPQENRHPNAQPAHFSEDSRRILISSHHRHIAHHSTEAVILATYRQVFGRDISASQRDLVAETEFRGGRITMREFVRKLAKTKAFRRAYWENLYVTKAAEVIHRRLLGRPTYDRRETNKYYDICGRQGFYALIDAIIDSDEYAKAFGEDTVPYERYITPRGLSARHPQGPAAFAKQRENPLTVEAYMMRYVPSKDRLVSENGNGQAPSSPLSDRDKLIGSAHSASPSPVPIEEDQFVASDPIVAEEESAEESVESEVVTA